MNKIEQGRILREFKVPVRDAFKTAGKGARPVFLDTKVPKNVEVNPPTTGKTIPRKTVQTPSHGNSINLYLDEIGRHQVMRTAERGGCAKPHRCFTSSFTHQIQI